MDWSDAAISSLIDLWNQGYSVSQIARALGCRPAQISGKTTRLIKAGRIQGRGSPLGKCPPKKKADAPAQRLIRRDPIAQPRVPVAPIPQSTRAGPCCWLVSHEKRGFPVYCEAPVHPGKPYCEAHCAVAFVSKVEDAA